MGTTDSITTTDGGGSRYSRRQVLGAGGVVLLSGLAGCTSGRGTSTPTPTASPGGTPTATPGTGGAGTYIHGEYGYSFQLPSGWTVDEDVTVDGVTFASVLSVSSEGGEVGRIYVDALDDDAAGNDAVETLVESSRDLWDTVETGELVIGDGQSLPVATLGTADYLRVRWLSAMAGGTRFDVIAALGTEVLTPSIASAVDTVLRSFVPPAAAGSQRRLGLSARSTALVSLLPVRTLRVDSGAIPTRSRSLTQEGDASPCLAQEERLGEINASLGEVDGEMERAKQQFDSELADMLKKFAGVKDTSPSPFKVMSNAFELISILCKMVSAFVSGQRSRGSVRQEFTREQSEAAEQLRQCWAENPDARPGLPTAEVGQVTRQSITLDLKNVPMDRFAIRMVVEDGGVERLVDLGPIEAPGGRFSSTVDYADYGLSLEDKRVRSMMVLVPVQGSGSDRPATAVASVSDPFGDYAN